jgi:SAM-dependent methyltransferase
LPTLGENRSWSTYHWSDAGEEWSTGFGDTYRLWSGFLLPRIGDLLPAARVLEIAPGFGRLTEHLRKVAEHLVVVDMTPECIEACRRRFEGATNIEYHVNDGQALPMIADRSIDFAFSWDSLVHVESGPLSSYLRELGRVLRPGGTAFLHHSNLGDYLDPSSGRAVVSVDHWRASSVNAALVREECRQGELECLTQELIPWGGKEFIDAFSLLRRPLGDEARAEPLVAEHAAFLKETGNLLRLKKLYADRESSPGPATHEAAPPPASPLPLRYRLADQLYAQAKGNLRRVPWIRGALERWLSR